MNWGWRGLFLLMSLVVQITYAGKPVWTFEPLTPTTVSVPVNQTVNVQYLVTNQSSLTHTLVMQPITGVTQITGPGLCSSDLTLASKASCTLSLAVDGALVASGDTKGPVLCEQGSELLCYRPASANTLNVTIAPSAYSVGGTVVGYGSSSALVLETNTQSIAMQQQSISSNGNFAFSQFLITGDSYNVTIVTQPTGQTCTVTNGSGTISGADITNIGVSCYDLYTLGGTVSNLAVSESLVLQNNLSTSVNIYSDGEFSFPTQLAAGDSYSVTVQTQPATQTCSVLNGIGTMPASAYNGVRVSCTDNVYSLGGSVSGLTSGSFTIVNNLTNPMTISQNGSYTYNTLVAEGGSYSLTIQTQPPGLFCMISNASGNNITADITNININCVPDTTLVSSIDSLVLFASGETRSITITNSGTSTAENLSISHSLIPMYTTYASNCGTSLSAGASCTIAVTPGQCSSSNCDLLYSSPTATVITVSASNVVNSAVLEFVVLNYGCIYQKGYVFVIDDTTPNTTSIGGTTVDLFDSAQTYPWSNTYISGIAASFTDGESNTQQIIAQQGSGSYAANYCNSYSIDSDGNSPCVTGTCYTGWYLPAICQMSSMECSGTTTNMQDKLPDLISAQCVTGCLNGNYWSSTFSNLGTDLAWYQLFSASSNLSNNKNQDIALSVRCVRSLTS